MPNEDYKYDATGNRVVPDSAPAETPPIITGPHNRLTNDGTYSYQYDAQGNRTGRTKLAGDDAGATEIYDWNAAGRLKKVHQRVSSAPTAADVKTIDYVYDMLGRRVAKLIDEDGAGPGHARAEYFAWDDVGSDVVLELTDSDVTDTIAPAVARRNLWGPGSDELLAVETTVGQASSATQTLWTLADNNSNNRDVVTFAPDGSGGGATSVVQHYVFDSFGQLSPLSGNGDPAVMPYFFAGQEYDAETGLTYMDARYYDAFTHQFISPDPINADPNNTFRYVGNNPISHKDETGLADGWGFSLFDDESQISLFPAPLPAADLPFSVRDIVGLPQVAPELLFAYVPPPRARSAMNDRAMYQALLARISAGEPIPNDPIQEALWWAKRDLRVLSQPFHILHNNFVELSDKWKGMNSRNWAGERGSKVVDVVWDGGVGLLQGASGFVTGVPAFIVNPFEAAYGISTAASDAVDYGIRNSYGNESVMWQLSVMQLTGVNQLADSAEGRDINGRPLSLHERDALFDVGLSRTANTAIIVSSVGIGVLKGASFVRAQVAESMGIVRGAFGKIIGEVYPTVVPRAPFDGYGPGSLRYLARQSGSAATPFGSAPIFKPTWTRLAPGGGLNAHEGPTRGHMLKMHVGWTDGELLQRLIEQRKLKAASTFLDQAAAESYIAEAIDANSTAIKDWLRASEFQKTLPAYELPGRRIAGRTWIRGWQSPTDAYSVRIILRRNPSMPQGYHIHTAYPER